MLGELPHDWKWAKFKDLLEIPLRNGIYKKKEFHGSGCKIVNMGELFAYPRIQRGIDMKRVELSEKELEKSTLKVGDLIFARRSLTAEGAGKCCVILSLDEDTTFESSIIRARLKQDVANPEFYYYLFNSPFGKWLLGTILRQVAVSGITGSDLAKLDVPVPPKAVQNQIVDHGRALDNKIALNRQISTTLESMAQALFKSWFVDFDPVIDNALAAGNEIPDALQKRAAARAARREALRQQTNKTANETIGATDSAGVEQALPDTGLSDQRLPTEIQQLFPDRFVFTEEMGWVPEGWEVSSFGKVSKCFDSKRIPLSKKQREEKKPGTIPYYGATSEMDQVNEWIFDDIYLLVGEDGSVIKDDGTPFTQYIWGKSWVNNHAHVLQGSGSVTTEHLMLFMQHQNMSAYVTGAVQLKINQKNMNSIPFVKALDDLNDYFGQFISPYYEKYRALSEQIELLSDLRDSLLPKLLSGQVTIPDAEQQLAEVL